MHVPFNVSLDMVASIYSSKFKVLENHLFLRSGVALAGVFIETKIM